MLSKTRFAAQPDTRELIYKMQDRNETFDYLEGNDPPSAPGQPPDAGVSQVMELSDARRLKNLPMNVEFLLTRAKRQEQREAAMAAIPMGVQYGQLSPPDQTRMNDAFVQLFRALGFDDPERFFPKPAAQGIGGSAPAAAVGPSLAARGASPGQASVGGTPPQTAGAAPWQTAQPGQSARGQLPSNVIPDADDEGRISGRTVFHDPNDAV